MVMNLLPGTETKADRRPTDHVVVVHGIGANRWVMWPLQRSLEKASFRVSNFGYNSLRTLRETSDQLARHLEQMDRERGEGRIHVVGHSMGCILSRLALSKFRPSGLGRMVMMTPPSRGTPSADRLAPWLARFIPPIGELTTQADSLVNSLPDPDYPFAIIRASRDFIIPAAYTELPGAAATWTAPTFHSSVLWHEPTLAQVVRFLDTERLADFAPTRHQDPPRPRQAG